jgi:hypothetical protein
MFKIITILLISLCVLIGCTDAEAAKPPENRPPVIEPSLTTLPVPSKDTSPLKLKKPWNVKVDSVERPGKSLEWSPYGRTEEASGEWLVIEITLKNIGTSNKSLQRDAFKIKDAHGKIYNHYSDLTVAELYSLYRDGDLIDNIVFSPGSTISSYLVFDISTHAIGLQLEFTPNLFAKSEVFALENLPLMMKAAL